MVLALLSLFLVFFVVVSVEMVNKEYRFEGACMVSWPHSETSNAKLAATAVTVLYLLKFLH